MRIKILLTGGTIDKNYNESNGELNFVETHIPEILALGRNQSNLEIESLMMKDSLEMDESDRNLITKACVESDQTQIVITHGTDTMVETAKAIAAQNLEKTIVLVGAMVPFVFKHSDAMFNLGFAMAVVQTKSSGVYIAMNGQIFTWDDVKKNKVLGQFESI